MASAGKFLNAPTAQTGELAGQATPRPTTTGLNKPLAALQNNRAFLDPIMALPFELMGIIFQFALPSLDIMAWNWDIRACHPYMAALYILRRVSTMWKDIVDGTPSLWAVICGSFPENVNLTSLVRSGSCRLVIYFPGPSWSVAAAAFREFLAIIEPHIHRCSSLALWIESDLIGSVPSLSPLRLVALKIRTDPGHIRLPGEAIPFTREIEISDEALEKIRAVDLTRAPMNWVRTMKHLIGLRTLALDGVYSNNITLDHVLSVLVSSPGIETLTISNMEIEHPPSSLHPPIEPILLPHLRSITLSTNGALTNGLLRRIRPSPEITKLEIRPTGFPPDVPTSFWHGTMVSWIAVVQRLCQNSSGPTIHLAHRNWCWLESNSRYHLSILFADLSQVAALRWIQDVISPVADVDNWGLQLRVSDAALENDGVLAFIQTMRGVSAIIVGRLDRPSREAFISVFGQPTTDSAGTPALKSTFPTLQKLVFLNWTGKLDSIIDMLKKRHSIRSLYRQQIPDLTLDLPNMEPWSRRWREKTIISFLDKKALIDLDGVKEVRRGCVRKDPGRLAIVWDEEKSLPAWG